MQQGKSTSLRGQGKTQGHSQRGEGVSADPPGGDLSFTEDVGTSADTRVHRCTHTHTHNGHWSIVIS